MHGRRIPQHLVNSSMKNAAEYRTEWTHWGKCRAKVINYHTSHHIAIAEAPWLFKGISYRSAKWVSGTATSQLAGQQHRCWLQPSSACSNRGGLVKRSPLPTWHLASDDWGGMQKLTGTNYVWEAGRLKSRSTNVEEAWKSHAICQTAAVKCVLSWGSACSRLIITIIIQDVCVHTGAISHGAQSLKESIVLYTSALAVQFTTIHSCTQRLFSSADPIMCPAEPLPVWSSGRRLAASLFWWFLFVGIKKILSLFENRHYYYDKGFEDEMGTFYNKIQQKQCWRRQC